MNILAIETTGTTASVAIINESGDVWEEASDAKLNHLQFLMPMIDKVLEQSQLQIDDLTAIAASEGPGSFTGIRIGVSSARALAQALNLPCISVPTLKTFLYNQDYDGIVCPLFDARRSQVYGGAYQWICDTGNSVPQNMKIREVVEGKAYDLEEILEILKSAILDQGICSHKRREKISGSEKNEIGGNSAEFEKNEMGGNPAEFEKSEIGENPAEFEKNEVRRKPDEAQKSESEKTESEKADSGSKSTEVTKVTEITEITFFGDGADKYRAEIQQWQNSSLNGNIQIKVAEAGVRYQKASSVAKLALDLYKNREVCHYNELKPNYMRKAEAERKLEEAEKTKVQAANRGQRAGR